MLIVKHSIHSLIESESRNVVKFRERLSNAINDFFWREIQLRNSLLPSLDVPIAPAPSTLAEQPFIGWRYKQRVLPNGEIVLDEILLTVEDALYPEEGDQIPVNTLHFDEMTYLKNVFAYQLRCDASARVFGDAIINWGVPGQRNTCPDVSVFVGVKDPEEHWGIFPLVEQGARVVLVVELVSLSTRNNDLVHKYADYHRVGIPIYILVDQAREDGPRRLSVLHWAEDDWIAAEPDAQGRFTIEPLGLQLALRENKLVCFDLSTGEELGNFTEQKLQLDETKTELKASQAEVVDAKAKLALEAKASEEMAKRIKDLEAELERLRGNP